MIRPILKTREEFTKIYNKQSARSLSAFTTKQTKKQCHRSHAKLNKEIKGYTNLFMYLMQFLELQWHSKFQNTGQIHPFGNMFIDLSL